MTDKRGKEPEKLEQDLLQLFKVNVVGQIHLFNLAMPLIMKGKVKKIIAISSGFGIADLVRQYNLHNAAPYCISKAALNMAVAQFSAQYSKDGVLVISVSPGTVDTGHWDNGELILLLFQFRLTLRQLRMRRKFWLER